MATSTSDPREFEGWVSDEIRTLVRNDPGNRLDRLDASPIFDEPLVGFVAGDDPIFAQLKEVIGSFHLMPIEAALAKAEQRGVPSASVGEVGVVSYVLPISSATRKENARMKDRPSRRWAHTRLFGEAFNRAVQIHLVRVLEEQGYIAVAPELEESLFRMFIDERVGWTSRWSQRHVAFAAGLWTFGLSDALITPAGKAHRVGSVVVNRALDSPHRTEDIHRDCLSYQGINCRTCMKRCPAEAITEAGHDKARCAEFVLKQFPFVKEEYGIEIYGCGLCQTRVPCEGRIPRAGDVE